MNKEASGEPHCFTPSGKMGINESGLLESRGHNSHLAPVDREGLLIDLMRTMYAHITRMGMRPPLRLRRAARE